LGNNRTKHETSFNGVLSLLHSSNRFYLTIPLENKLKQFRFSGMVLVANHYHNENDNHYQLSYLRMILICRWESWHANCIYYM